MSNEIKRITKVTDAFSELEKSAFNALETYSNVHRGSGHFSILTTHLFEQARDIMLEYLGLNKRKYKVIFCTPLSASKLMAQLDTESYQILSSNDFGLPLGMRALAVKKNALPKGAPVQTGGGTARLISRNWVVWAISPDRFEAGTPAIINVIAFSKALIMIKQLGNDIFKNPISEKLTATEILYHDKLEKYRGIELLNELKKTLIGRGVQVPTMEGVRPFVNLDYGASTPTFMPIWNTTRQTWRQSRQVQHEIVHEVGSICMEVLGAPPTNYEVIFTSNTTEAINLVAESLGLEIENDIEPVVLSTILEHSSNDLPWRMIPNHSLIRLSVDKEGFLDLNELEKVLSAYNREGIYGKKRIKLVAVSGASNVLGTYNDLEEIGRIAHEYGVRLLVDAAQLVAHRKIDMESFGIDYLVFSAHKVYAPFGSGALVVKKGLLRFSPVEMELIQSSGEENAGGIAAMGKALILIKQIGLTIIKEEEQALTRKVLYGLSQIDGVQMYGITEADSPKFAQRGGVIPFSVKGMMSDNVAKELTLQGGIGVRNGCHCAHILVKHVLGVGPKLESFQRIIVSLFPRLELPGVVRVSLGIGHSEKEVETLIRVLRKIAEKDEKSKDKQTTFAQKGSPILSKAVVQKQINDFVKAASLKVY